MNCARPPIAPPLPLDIVADAHVIFRPSISTNRVSPCVGLRERQNMNNIIWSPRSWMRALGAAALLLCLDVRQAHAAAITFGSRIDLTPTTFALPIEIGGAVGVSEWFLDLTYDPTDVQINVGCDPLGGDIYCSLLTGPVTEGDFFAAGAPFNLLVPGFIELDPTTLDQAGRLFGMHGAFGGSAPAPSGDGILAYIEFNVLGTGDSPIEPGGTVVSQPVAAPEPDTSALLAGSLLFLGGLWRFTRTRRPRSFANAATGVGVAQ